MINNSKDYTDNYYEKFANERIQSLTKQLEQEKAKENPNEMWIQSLEGRIWYYKNC